jgi:glycosyltransferase involved in cell wall biosynthesis
VHGDTGFLVESDTPGGVAAALRAVVGDRARARAMGAAGRRRAEQEFSRERAVDTVERAYHEVLGGGA